MPFSRTGRYSRSPSPWPPFQEGYSRAHYHEPYNQAPEQAPMMVKMKKLPFYETVSSLKEMQIRDTGGTHIQILFFLSPSHLQYLTREPNNPHRVHVRFCKHDVTGEQNDYFSGNLQVSVNNVFCRLPGMDVVPKGPAAPVDITDKCNYSQSRNYISIRTSEHLMIYVHIVRRLKCQDLLYELLSKNVIHPEVTASKIRDKLKEGNLGEEIASTSMPCSLLCPLSKTRMQIPCRASSCRHIQCFDAYTYLKMNERKAKWCCPVCSASANYDHLQIDGYFKNIIEHHVVYEKILLQMDGTWKPLLPSEKVEALDGNVSVLTLDDTAPEPASDSDPKHPSMANSDSDDDIIIIDCVDTHSTDNEASKKDFGEQVIYTVLDDTVTLSDDSYCSTGKVSNSFACCSTPKTPLRQQPCIQEISSSYLKTPNTRANTDDSSPSPFGSSSTPQRSSPKKVKGSQVLSNNQTEQDIQRNASPTTNSHKWTSNSSQNTSSFPPSCDSEDFIPLKLPDGCSPCWSPGMRLMSPEKKKKKKGRPDEW